MRNRSARRLSVAATLLAVGIVALSSCAKRRPVPVPPPVVLPAPPPPAQPEAPVPPRTETPAHPIRLNVPDGCQPAFLSPWFQCNYQSPSGERMLYYLAIPRDVPPSETVPILTFLHGSSGSGPGDGKPLSGGHRFGTELWISDTVRARYPSVVVVPQADPPPGETWVRFWRAPAPGETRPKEALVLVMEILDVLEARYPVDPRRRYLLGQSMGGFGAWLAYTRYPGHFAAIVPVCGGGDPGAVVPNPTAIWAFHGARDPVVPVTRSREMVAAIEAAGGQLRYREYPELDHNIFDEAFGEPGLVEWLYSQRLPQN